MNEDIKQQDLDDDIKFDLFVEKINKKTDRLEKISWNKKREKLQKTLDEFLYIQNRLLTIEAEKLKLYELLQPLETEDKTLIEEKIKLNDEIQVISKTMRSKCIHPRDQLLMDSENNIIVCKFCDTRMKF